MAESKEPQRPAAGTPGAPLPRLWKTEPDEGPEAVAGSEKKATTDQTEKAAQPAPSARPAKKARGSAEPKAGKEPGAKTVLKEETPTFDTHEARQRVRLILGGGLSSVLLVVGFVVAVRVTSNQTSGRGDEAIPQEMLALTSTAGTQPLRDEEEARLLFDRARDVARNRNTKLAVAILKRLRTNYPRTSAAVEAKDALDRPEQNPPLPLFLDRPVAVAVVPDPPAPKAEPPEPEVKVVDASRTTVASTTGSRADLVMPVNPAEPPLPNTPAPSVAAMATRSLPKGFQARPGAEIHDSGWPTEVVGDRDGAPMLLVPGGTFVQGRDGGDPNEAPEHKVTLGTFYVDRHEVTVRQFRLFQKEAGKRTERARALAKEPGLASLDDVEDRPVVMVTAREAKDFADWAGKCLPTEAQWEAAARTPDGRIFPWGPEPPAWNKPRLPRQIDPVMSFPTDVSPYGVFDLAGNAWEWTKDWYEPRFYQQFRSATADNPFGPAKPRSLQLVVKGIAKDWTVSKREGFRFDARQPYIGFRCVLQVDGPGNVFEPPQPPPAPGQPASTPRGGIVPF